MADRAIWNEPGHPKLHIALSDGPAMLIERDIKHSISERTTPGEYHDEESDYVSHVRKLRREGSGGTRRMHGLLEEDEMELLIECIHVTTGRAHPGWISDSLFRIWRERHGFWHTVTYKGWRSTLVDTGLPFVSEQRGTAALQRHFLLTTEKRAAIMKQRLELAKILWDSTTIGTQRIGEGLPCKEVCIRIISKEFATFSGGSGETLEDLTEDLTQRIDIDHPPIQGGVQAILRRRHAAQSKESRDMAVTWD